MHMRLFLAGIAAITSLGAATAASAEPAWLAGSEVNQEGVQSIRINASDLDLATLEGANALRDRVRSAALMVCSGPLPDEISYSAADRARASCRKATIRSVDIQVAELVERAKSGAQATEITMQQQLPARSLR
jgi:UrcA family protein